jgi:carbamoyltransferase
VTVILGISAFFHDAAAALLVDGQIVAAAQEERFSRVKHDERFPNGAIEFCLQKAGCRAEDVDFVAFYEKPLLKFDRLLESSLAYAPRGLPVFLAAMPRWLRDKLFLRREIRKAMGGRLRRRVVFAEHHESHAASAFFASPFDEAAVLTMDGVGEWSSSSLGVGQGNRISLFAEMHFPHSLGLLYSAFTAYCGFRINSGEYKLMGLAPYGEPRYVERILKHLVDLREDGSFFLNQTYFRYVHGLSMTSSRFHRLFGRPPRPADTEIQLLDCDLAASIQRVTETIVLRTARHLHRTTGQRRLCMAGGVALNCVANGRLAREGPFDEIWIQPAAGDAGGSLGVALFLHYQLLGNQRESRSVDMMRGALLGPAYSTDQVREVLDEQQAVYRICANEDELIAFAVEQLKQERVLGFFHGPMEFGPRALGARSILADPRVPAMRERINRHVKNREGFRPFAPIVMHDRVGEFFDVPTSWHSPYMLFTAPVHPRQRIALHDANSLHGLDRRHTPRSTIPAVTHVDDSARVQTVRPDQNRRLYRLLTSFAEQTDCPVLVNTSLNVRGEPMVCSPLDAFRCFLVSDLDAMVIERAVLLKHEQSPELIAAARRDFANGGLD